MQHFGRLSILLLSSLFAAQFAFADPLYNFDTVSQTFADSPVALGFVFTADTTFSVTSLGWFDGAGTGFQTPHTVGIFDRGILMTSATLEPGTSDPLSGSFRYQSIAPITLEAGNTYTLAGTSGGSLDTWTVNDDVSGFTINPAFSIEPNAAVYEYGSAFLDPAWHYSDYVVYAGPNLEGSPVPEPASLFLLALAVPILLIARKYHSNSI